MATIRAKRTQAVALNRGISAADMDVLCVSVCVTSGDHTFEVDEFYGENEGLVIAEVELASEDEPYEKPDFIAEEVTGDRRYYNSHLRKNPFSVWGQPSKSKDQ